MKKNTIKKILDEKIIVIVRGVNKEKLIPFAEALYNGGIRLMEITFSSDGAISDEETSQNIMMLTKHFCNRMLIGSGTVLTKEQVRLTARAGGKFVISPDTNEEVIKETLKQGLVSIPGALTPTEAQSAYKHGADFVKLFPISSLGTSYIKALCAPLSHIKFLAVGGVNEKNISEYIRAGAVGVGIGGNITSLLAESNYEAITDLAKRYVEVVNNG